MRNRRHGRRGSLGLEFLRQDQFHPIALGSVIHVIENGVDEVQPQAAGLDGIQRTPGPLARLGGGAVAAVVAKPETETAGDLLAGEPDEARLLLLISVADDVCACLIHAQDDQVHVALGQARFGRKLPDQAPDRTEIAGVTGELDLSLHRIWNDPAGAAIAQAGGFELIVRNCVPFCTPSGPGKSLAKISGPTQNNFQ